ncbi:hypothetical protein [Candidatus Hodgkinia cicadicola]
MIGIDHISHEDVICVGNEVSFDECLMLKWLQKLKHLLNNRMLLCWIKN